MIRQKELRALNRVLKATGKPAKEEPTPAATYGATKTRYEAFNGQVAKEGADHFENAGRAVHFRSVGGHFEWPRSRYVRRG